MSHDQVQRDRHRERTIRSANYDKWSNLNYRVISFEAIHYFANIHPTAVSEVHFLCFSAAVTVRLGLFCMFHKDILMFF